MLEALQPMSAEAKALIEELAVGPVRFTGKQIRSIVRHRLGSAVYGTVTLARIHNLTYSLRPDRNADMTSGIAEIKKQGCWFAWHTDERGVVLSLVWLRHDQSALFQRYGSCVIIDNTYGADRHDYKLCLFTCVDNHGLSVVVGQGLMATESTADYTTVFQNFQQLHRQHGVRRPDFVMLDCSDAETAAAASVWPDAIIAWCSWHMTRHFSKKVTVPQQLEEFRKEFYRCSHIENEALFLSEWKAVMAKWEAANVSFMPWLRSQIDRNKRRWAACYLHGVFTAGLRASQRGEDANKRIKESLGAAAGLQQLVVAALDLNTSSEHQHRQEEARLTAVNVTKTKLEEKARSTLTRYSVTQLLVPEIEAALNKYTVVRCAAAVPSETIHVLRTAAQVRQADLTRRQWDQLQAEIQRLEGIRGAHSVPHDAHADGTCCWAHSNCGSCPSHDACNDTQHYAVCRDLLQEGTVPTADDLRKPPAVVVRQNDILLCTCRRVIWRGVSCRHIIAVNRLLGIVTFDRQYFQQHWARDTSHSELQIVGPARAAAPAAAPAAHHYAPVVLDIVAKANRFARWLQNNMDKLNAWPHAGALLARLTLMEEETLQALQPGYQAQLGAALTTAAAAAAAAVAAMAQTRDTDVATVAPAVTPAVPTATAGHTGGTSTATVPPAVVAPVPLPPRDAMISPTQSVSVVTDAAGRPTAALLLDGQPVLVQAAPAKTRRKRSFKEGEGKRAKPRNAPATQP